MNKNCKIAVVVLALILLFVGAMGVAQFFTTASFTKSIIVIASGVGGIFSMAYLAIQALKDGEEDSITRYQAMRERFELDQKKQEELTQFAEKQKRTDE